MLEKIAHKLLQKKVTLLSSALFLVLPLFLLLTNMPKVTSLKYDRTPERLGEDILRTVPNEAILLLLDDTTVFSTEYIYFTTGGRDQNRGIKLLQAGICDAPFYRDVLNQQYAELELTKLNQDIDVCQTVASKYYGTYPIFSGTKLVVGEEFTWLPEGLLYRLYRKDELEKVSTVEYVQRSHDLFSTYQNPVTGALGEYQHALLIDVARVYAGAKLEVGRLLFGLGHKDLAINTVQDSYQYYTDIANVLELGKMLVDQNKCDQATKLYSQEYDKYAYDAEINQDMASYNRRCLHDETAAKKYDEVYKQKSDENKTRLQNF